MFKRFLIFSYDCYYPGGGWQDFQRDFDTYEEAKWYVNGEKEHRTYNSPDYYQIVDLHTGIVDKIAGH